MIDLTQEYLKQIVRYDPETGLFYWASQRNWRTPVGKVAGTPDKDGYVKIRIDHKAYTAHRLAFLYMTGAWPKDQVDHINLDKPDNRWANLREATASQNAANRPVKRNGLKGVHFDGWKWRAFITHERVTRMIGSRFESEQEAHEAYLVEAKKCHGEFARA